MVVETGIPFETALGWFRLVAENGQGESVRVPREAAAERVVHDHADQRSQPVFGGAKIVVILEEANAETVFSFIESDRIRNQFPGFVTVAEKGTGTGTDPANPLERFPRDPSAEPSIADRRNRFDLLRGGGKVVGR